MVATNGDTAAPVPEIRRPEAASLRAPSPSSARPVRILPEHRRSPPIAGQRRQLDGLELQRAVREETLGARVVRRHGVCRP